MLRTALVAALLTALTPMPGSALDLTGTWEGKWKCKIFAAGVKEKLAEKDSLMRITQTGNTLAIHLDAVDRYAGVAVEDAVKPEKGEAGMVTCTTNNDLAEFGGWDEMIHFKAKAKMNGKGVLKGRSVWSDPGPHIATCSYKYKRTSTADPQIPGCP